MKVIMPMAGKGTRLLPLTKGIESYTHAIERNPLSAPVSCGPL